MSRRVLLYAHSLAVANPTGIHRYCVELASAMAAVHSHDFGLEVWTGSRPAGPDIGVPIRQVPVHRRALNLAWGTVGAPRLERLTGPADLVHQLLPAFPLPSRAPLVATIHDLLPMQHPEWYEPRERWGFRKAMRLIEDRAAKLVVLSEWVARDLMSTLGIASERIAVVPGGVHAGFSTPASPAEVAATCDRVGVRPGEFFLSVGAIEPRKNLVTLIRAVAELRSRGGQLPNLVLVGGDGHGAAAVRAAPDEYGVADAVRFLGRVSDDELHALMGAALGLAHPSWFEGYGFPPLEAMAAGVPVIASNAGSLPEVVGDAGILLAPNDPVAWADALLRLVEDGELREALAATGRRRASTLSWEAAASKTLQVYADILG
jgi:glycosyltransferase involved in cell wall biosynthesis